MCAVWKLNGDASGRKPGEIVLIEKGKGSFDVISTCKNQINYYILESIRKS